MRLPKADNPVKAPDESKVPYDVWRHRPTSANMSLVLDDLRPTISSALKTYASGNVSPITRGRAKYLTIGAVQSYDPARGASLKSHVMLQLHPLTRYTTQAMQPMKLSERRLRQLKSLRDLEQEFQERHGREASDAELADELGLSMTRINRVRTYANPFVSTEAADEAVGTAPTVSQINPMEVWLDYVYHDLGNIDRKILDWKMARHGQPVLRNVEIARRLGITPAAVTQRAAKIQARIYAGQEVAV